MLLTKLTGTITDLTGVPKLTPAPPVTPQERYISKGLTVGTITSWPSTTGTPALAVTGTGTVVTESGVNVFNTDGTTTRFGVNSGVAMRTASVLVKLPATTTGTDWIIGPNTTTNGYVGYDSAAGGGTLYYFNGTATSISLTGITGGGWVVISITISDTGGAATLSCNKTRVSGTLGTQVTTGGIRVAGHFSLGQFIAARWAEINLFDRVQTPTELDGLVDYYKAAYPTLLP